MVSGVTYASRLKSSLFAFSSRLAREAASLAGIEEPLRLAARDLPRDRSLVLALIEGCETVLPRVRRRFGKLSGYFDFANVFAA
jgi:hypothetical protein